MSGGRQHLNLANRAARNRRPPTGTVAGARESFHSAEPVDTAAVRNSISASWVRCKEWQVSVDPFELPYEPNLDRESQLAYSAGPVLTEAHAGFANEPITIILTDAAGIVLDRRASDAALRRKLDQVSLAPGFSYAEQFAGTNGIGTALESRGPAQVFGHEHYVEHLEELACAGAPIRHPVTGKLLGVVDLTCWRIDADPTLLVTATSLARRIEEAILEDVGRREFALLRQYLAATRQGLVPAMAISNDLVMMNDRARELIDPQDQIALLGQATETLADGKARVFTTVLPSGATAEVHCQPSDGGPGSVGGVIQVQLVAARRAPAAAESRGSKQVHQLPGIVGASMQWLKCCADVEEHFTSDEWLDLTGEPGVGKFAVARATHLARTPGEHLRVLDADDCQDAKGWLLDVASELAGESGTLILRHVDRLPSAVVASLSELLEAARASESARPWVVATRWSGETSEELNRLVWCFGSSVEVPPLRHHLEDIPEVIDLFLARHTKTSNLTFSPDAMRVLMRNRWRGNVEQLLGTLRKIVAHRRTGVIGVADLPAECLATTRRVLSPLESIECDAIVESLITANGDRARAARHLGMSRATIYRKIRDYGIAVPRQSTH
ncbi:MAG: sigma-54-dependent Fis family transcriptional regulator [Geodermatophilaceae bacterium]